MDVTWDVVGIEDGWDVLLRLEPAGGETAADDPPNGTGESLKKIYTKF